jgi:hypothetical protein
MCWYWVHYSFTPSISWSVVWLMAWAIGINWPYCYSFSIQSSQQYCTLYIKGVFFYGVLIGQAGKTPCLDTHTHTHTHTHTDIHIYISHTVQLLSALYSWSYIATCFNNLIDLGCDMWCNVPKLVLKIRL